MAISVPTSIGTAFGGSSPSVSVNTTSAAPSNALILISVSWYLATHSASGVTAAGGSLTWTKIADVHGSADADRYGMIFAAQAPSGVPLATPISVTDAGGSANNLSMAISYVTGHDTTTALDAISAGSNGTGSTWATGNVTTTQANTLLYGMAYRDGLSTSAADTGTGWTELNDFQNTTDSVTLTTVYKIVSATGTYSTSGTWTGGAGEWVSTLVAIKEAGGGGGSTVQPVGTFNPIPFMGR